MMKKIVIDKVIKKKIGFGFWEERKNWKDEKKEYSLYLTTISNLLDQYYF